MIRAGGRGWGLSRSLGFCSFVIFFFVVFLFSFVFIAYMFSSSWVGTHGLPWVRCAGLIDIRRCMMGDSIVMALYAFSYLVVCNTIRMLFMGRREKTEYGVSFLRGFSFNPIPNERPDRERQLRM